jgi:serine/threonine-protein kinase
MENPDPAPLKVAPGDIIAGKYRVERVLGQGGMGVVVAAHHILLDEKVALKFLLPEAMEVADAVARFEREARAAVKIKSEHVARVTDVGRLETGSPYIVMEYLEGVDLATWRVEHQVLQLAEAVDLILQACEAIAEAHALGIVHRDLKPANLFLARRPSGPPIVKVLDFGISKSTLAAAQSHLTHTTALLGTPHYMSPEQMQSARTVDVRSDIWALGVIVYELLGGRLPFEGETLTELIAAVLTRETEPLRSHRADLPPAVEDVVSRCLAKNPAARYANIGQLAIALAPFGSARSAVSVERILHVLGQAAAQGPSRAAMAGANVSAVASTPSQTAGTFRDATHDAVLAPGQTTEAPLLQDSVEIPGVSQGRGLLWVAGATLLLAGGGAAWWLGARSTPTAATALATPEPSGSERGALPVTSVSLDASLVALSTATLTAPSVSVPSPRRAAGAPSSTPSNHLSIVPTQQLPLPAPSNAPTAAPPAAPVAKPNCTPPYVVDAAGHHVYKPECN